MTPTEYRHDVFLSYSRAESWPTFVDLHFRPILDHWLTAELGRKARVYQDVKCIEDGQHWPEELKIALSTSRVMVALWSRNYFESEWCRDELAHMLARADSFRAKSISGHIIFPLSIHDCDHEELPEAVRHLQTTKIHQYADPFMHPRSKLRHRLSEVLRPICQTISNRVEDVADDTFTWPPQDHTDYRAKLLRKRVRATAGRSSAQVPS